MKTIRLLKNRVINGFNSLTGRSYPSRLGVRRPNQGTLDFIATTDCRTIAEIGIYNGYTSEGFARFLNGRGELHLYDYEFKVSAVVKKLNEAGYRNVRGIPNSSKSLDSYNWSLMKVLEESRGRHLRLRVHRRRPHLESGCARLPAGRPVAEGRRLH